MEKLDLSLARNSAAPTCAETGSAVRPVWDRIWSATYSHDSRFALARAKASTISLRRPRLPPVTSAVRP
jgi:hypothetical protein